jgi:hypothetical protein
VEAACSGVCRVAACEEDAAVSLLEAAAWMVDVAAACSCCVGACRVQGEAAGQRRGELLFLRGLW